MLKNMSEPGVYATVPAPEAPDPCQPMPERLHKNVILLGMPGSGKSTLGKLLAEKLGWHLVDTDLLMEATHDRPLQDIFDLLGYEKF